MKKNKPSANIKNEPEHVLVYSTDKLPEKICSSCNNKISSCSCSQLSAQQIAAIRPVVQYEKKGRAGKAVTMLKKLPPVEDFLKDFCSYLKKALGAGGTFYVEEGEGVIEIQGDRRDRLLTAALKYLKR